MFGFNLSCVDMIHQVEKPKKSERVCFVSSQTVMHSGDELEQYARENHLTFEEKFYGTWSWHQV